MQAQSQEQDQIIMTPGRRTVNSTTIIVERCHLDRVDQPNFHVAGGAHKGIIINKSATGIGEDSGHPQLYLEFCVYLINAASSMHTKESRQLRFWFKDFLARDEQQRQAQEFFKNLVSPKDFPRDYVGFIKKIMKLMQHEYLTIRKIEIELKQLGQSTQPPPNTAKPGTILYSVGKAKKGKGFGDDLNSSDAEVTSARLLEMIESAYPTPLSASELARQAHSDKETVLLLLEELLSNGVIKTIGNAETFTRVVQNENQVKVVKQMPSIVKAKQPTIAIITAQYCEKLAVDSMMEDQQTFVRFTTVGESNVYTLGNIGPHRVVSTKLPTVGHTREAMIAAGSTTTRLLGIFQAVDYVFLVGVGGGVPHYTDHARHVRLGDIVVSSPSASNKAIYTYCEIEPPRDGQATDAANPVYETKSWTPPTLTLQEISARLKKQADDDPNMASWNGFIDEGIKNLSKAGLDFTRPSDETDKLYMSLGGSDVIEVTHPTDTSQFERQTGKPVVHLGPIAAGRQISKNDELRQDIAAKFGILAYDMEFDAVVDSIFGNRKDSYALIRGIADYKDGSRRKEWQPYASLAAAAFTKAVICSMTYDIDD